jgi:hypothetical protein
MCPLEDGQPEPYASETETAYDHAALTQPGHAPLGAWAL